MSSKPLAAQIANASQALSRKAHQHDKVLTCLTSYVLDVGLARFTRIAEHIAGDIDEELDANSPPAKVIPLMAALGWLTVDEAVTREIIEHCEAES